MEPRTGDLVTSTQRKAADVKSRSKVFYEGDVLYGRLRPYLNKIYLAAGKVIEGLCSGEFYVLISKPDKITPGYLRAILASSFVLEQVRDLSTGSALPRLPLSELLPIEVPVPPLAVQTAMAAELGNIAAKRADLKKELGVLVPNTLTDFEAQLIGGSSR